MMNCEEADRFLDAYLDGELEPDKRAELDQHLADCPECKEKLARLRQLREFFTANAPHYPAPPELRGKVLARLEVTRRSNLISLVRRPWLYAAALLIVSLVLAWLKFFPNQEEQVANQAVANFKRAALLERVCDIVSPDPGVVKPWFTGKIDFSPPVVLPGLNFQMRGGRLDVINNRKVAAVTYKRDKDLVTVFVWPDAGKPVPQKDWTISGYMVCAWNTKGLNFVAVSNMSESGLDEVVGHLKEAVASQ
ncbi:MAG: anti-sigma factor [Verrucomicrobia bacterium]|nr:anti-sigma factor [Verrucomicrobiota bacterium]MBV8277130.1 anti-sigma factor [Verrucomicrobiota bacterium]